MIPIVTDLRNAYEAHDHDAFHRHLSRLERMLRYMGPTPLNVASRCTGCDGQGRCAGKDRCDGTSEQHPRT